MRGHRKPGMDSMIGIAEGMKISLDELVGILQKSRERK
jgi:hypothetical protein